METLMDRYYAELAKDPEQKRRHDEERRMFAISELILGREYKKVGLKPTFFPTAEEIRNDVDMPVDSKSVIRKKMNIIRRVERCLRDPKRRRQRWGDIIDLPIERINEIRRAQTREWWGR